MQMTRLRKQNMPITSTTTPPNTTITAVTMETADSEEGSGSCEEVFRSDRRLVRAEWCLKFTLGNI